MTDKLSKICFLSSGRMDFGLISPVMQKIKESAALKLQFVVMGTHLSSHHGGNPNIQSLGSFEIDCVLDTLEEDDSALGISKTIANTNERFGKAMDRLKPDALVIAGDRYEMLACANIATIMSIPIIHLYGGDVSYGAYDENIRHAITKLSHLHFVSNSEAEKRVLQLGENPKHVFNFGAPSLSYLDDFSLLSKEELAKELEITFAEKNILATYHPVTRAEEDFFEFTASLEELSDQFNIFITIPNADNDGNAMHEELEILSNKIDTISLFKSLGSQRYLSMMKHVDVVLGNSSSGLYEAPSMKIATVNVGDRQKGRLSAESVIDCPCEKSEIIKSVLNAMELDCKNVINPYYQKNSSEKIAKTIESFAPFKSIIHKEFFSFA